MSFVIDCSREVALSFLVTGDWAAVMDAIEHGGVQITGEASQAVCLYYWQFLASDPEFSAKLDRLFL